MTPSAVPLPAVLFLDQHDSVPDMTYIRALLPVLKDRGYTNLLLEYPSDLPLTEKCINDEIALEQIEYLIQEIQGYLNPGQCLASLQEQYPHISPNVRDWDARNICEAFTLLEHIDNYNRKFSMLLRRKRLQIELDMMREARKLGFKISGFDMCVDAYVKITPEDMISKHAAERNALINENISKVAKTTSGIVVIVGALHAPHIIPALEIHTPTVGVINTAWDARRQWSMYEATKNLSLIRVCCGTKTDTSFIVQHVLSTIEAIRLSTPQPVVDDQNQGKIIQTQRVSMMKEDKREEKTSIKHESPQKKVKFY